MICMFTRRDGSASDTAPPRKNTFCHGNNTSTEWHDWRLLSEEGCYETPKDDWVYKDGEVVKTKTIRWTTRRWYCTRCRIIESVRDEESSETRVIG